MERTGKLVLAALLAMTSGCTVSQEDREQSQLSVPHARMQQEKTPSSLDTEQKARPAKMILDVPIISQKPELKYGCEVTSLAMLLQYAGQNVDKQLLAEQVKKDPEPLVQTNGDIKEWGDPNKGFVGDITGARKGFAVYNKPLEELLRRYMGERTVNLTGGSYQALFDSVAAGHPVVIWTTGDFRLPTEWESWYKDGKKVVAPFDEHAVLLVGYDEKYAYVNDPLTGVKQRRVPHTSMKTSWEALGKQALSYL
ncbi:peptidase C39 [Brevibacillus formosus]|uniref:Peptidase C39 n=2 Tax=Brevibacillus formosus TaxID=54913 RepID=A0A220MHJ1_9BACL|nr:C39 family peptidase [Brevibacillus formosus]ASJ54541.1 peptidase C39 [Brevibacillus formosus]